MITKRERPSVEKQMELELNHIKLELEMGRMNHMRHFIDQYYCFKHKFVNRNGGAHWEGLVWKGLVSKAARALSDRKQVVKEHVVPMRFICEELMLASEAGALSIEKIAEILDRLTHFGTITKKEDKLLRQAGLNQTMPEGFHDPDHPYYQDVLSRYHAVGIELEAAS